MEYEVFNESGIDFELSKDYLFRIEKSKTFLSINEKSKENEGVKTAEFLLLDDKNDSLAIWIIEAKTGTPQPAKEEDYNNFINEIKDKFYDSLSLFLALFFKRHQEEMPVNFHQVNLAEIKFKLVLIITSPTYKEEWLEPIKCSLHSTLTPLINKMAKIWSFPQSSILVINPSLANEFGLINNRA